MREKDKWPRTFLLRSLISFLNSRMTMTSWPLVTREYFAGVSRKYSMNEMAWPTYKMIVVGARPAALSVAGLL